MLGFCDAALFLHTLATCYAFFLRYVSWRRLRLGDAFNLGGAFFWRHVILATPSFLATRVFGGACRHFEREKDKD